MTLAFSFVNRVKSLPSKVSGSGRGALACPESQKVLGYFTGKWWIKEADTCVETARPRALGIAMGLFELAGYAIDKDAGDHLLSFVQIPNLVAFSEIEGC